MEVLGERPRRRRQQHLSEETKDLIAERSKIKQKCPSDGFNRSEYSLANKCVKKSCKKDDENWALRVAADLEAASAHGQQREVWQRIRSLSDTPPSRTEISEALQSLKNHKSPGVDEITNEQLKYGGSGLIDRLECLFRRAWESENVPEDWVKGIVVIVPQKGDTSYCSNNRGIALRSIASKLYQIVILRRINAGLEQLLRENQCGFRKNRSCIDQIYSLRTIIHNSIEYNLPLYINFVDFKAAFDSINREYIWKAFNHYGLPCK
ncbi:hypothetical protein ACHWQZ_G014732 [Mnemiopsis leidyi]